MQSQHGRGQDQLVWQGVVVGEEELSVSRGQRHRVFFSVFQSHPGLDVDRRPKEVWEIPFGYRVPLRAYRPKETNSLVVCFLGIPISPILTDHAAISEVRGSSLFPENGQNKRPCSGQQTRPQSATTQYGSSPFLALFFVRKMDAFLWTLIFWGQISREAGDVVRFGHVRLSLRGASPSFCSFIRPVCVSLR